MLHVTLTLFVRSYASTKNKPVWDKLRCTDPELLSAFKIKNAEAEFKPVVEVMKQCWDIEPKDRPKFRKIVKDLENVKSDYDYVE